MKIVLQEVWEMNETMKEAYKNSVDFWNKNFYISDEDMAGAEGQVAGEDEWKELAPSQKLADAIAGLKGCENVLDYGCGYGWASITAAKTGSKKITAVDVIDNGKRSTDFYAKAYGVADRIESKVVSVNWLSEEPAETYDGIICSNVVDVVPMDIARDIVKNLSRVAKKGAKIVIGLNHYAKPVADPEKGIAIEEGKYLFVNGVLRMMCLTDEEWTALLSEYFTVEKLDHFAWPGEKEEHRRLFFLKK